LSTQCHENYVLKLWVQNQEDEDWDVYRVIRKDEPGEEEEEEEDDDEKIAELDAAIIEVRP